MNRFYSVTYSLFIVALMSFSIRAGAEESAEELGVPVIESLPPLVAFNTSIKVRWNAIEHASYYQLELEYLDALPRIIRGRTDRRSNSNSTTTMKLVPSNAAFIHTNILGRKYVYLTLGVRVRACEQDECGGWSGQVLTVLQDSIGTDPQCDTAPYCPPRRNREQPGQL